MPVKAKILPQENSSDSGSVTDVIPDSDAGPDPSNTIELAPDPPKGAKPPCREEQVVHYTNSKTRDPAVVFDPPKGPPPPYRGAQVVYYNNFGTGEPCVAFIDSVNKDGTVNLTALILAEQSPAVAKKGIPFSVTNRHGSWNWGV